MLRALVEFALKNRWLVLGGTLVLTAWGIVSFRNLPIEAYPDVANNYVQIITQWPGRSAEEIERQVTVPVEIQMAGIPHLTHLRSTTLAGLSSLMLIFDDDSTSDMNRQHVLERLSQVSLPANLVPQMGTDWSPVGQIYWYTLESTNPAYDVMEKKSLEDWTLEKSFKGVTGVVDVSSFGGATKEYQIKLDPEKLVVYGLSIAQVEQQVANNNTNGGGSFIEEGSQQINVQSLGLYTTVQDIENTVVKTANGTAIRVKDIATVSQGPKIRLGQIGRATHRSDGAIVDNSDTVEGIVLLQKGDDSDPVLQGIHSEVEKLNNGILPKGVKIVPFLDRSDLVKFTVDTVERNLTEGVILVSIILFLFLGNVRGAIVVALTIPFALLFAAICLDLIHIPANLLSLGALDFGMVVDGTVVMIENMVRHLSLQNDTRTPAERIRDAAHEVQRPVFYARGIIITSYLPIFTLQSVEGRLFKPMAWTVTFALVGALVFAILIAPVMGGIVFQKGAKEWKNPMMHWLTGHYRTAVRSAILHRNVTLGVSIVLFAFALFLSFGGPIGSEFLPHLDEGSIWVRGTLPPSEGPTASIDFTNQARRVMASFPEVTQVVSQTGRPDDGTDTAGFFNTEYFVDLKPKEQWRPVFHQNKEALIAAIDEQLEKFPGVLWNYSQPISDNMEEAVSGVKGELAVKLYGDNLRTLENTAELIQAQMATIRGIEDLGVFRIVGQPNLNFTVDREAAARWGINVADVQDAIQTAVGSNALTQVQQGEARYDVTLRYQKPYRDTRQAIEDVRLLAPSGERVSLAQLTKVSTDDGAEQINREGGQRYIAIKYSVRGRDLGSTVEEAIGMVEQNVKLPSGYHLEWAGEFASQKRADKRMALVIPITVLAIFLILYTMFRSYKWSVIVLVSVIMASIGGPLALFITHTNFSVSSAVGFLALFGVSVETGVIMLEYINQLRARRKGSEVSDEEHIIAAAVDGAVLRLRPVMMTMLVATLGLLPAALSHAIGSDSQRPFAIVIVGGLLANLIIGVFLMPTLYVWMARENDVLPEVNNQGEDHVAH
ncbi:Heavy metal efflux pump, CzcA family [Candidatus Sulfotelmatomonas gaucii]|uniref:Heavy metal efflux pump, CzcA family n=1 Tax=Candidatus Sulfuritelmatomonas gaucii TaxID=2043161 RepID=A0A2N9LXZ2_9BACT|nr:Heavy metal efflux pump, CzcA family [Candidatus Sulfotelmatomonas gaucii]